MTRKHIYLKKDRLTDDQESEKLDLFNNKFDQDKKLSFVFDHINFYHLNQLSLKGFMKLHDNDLVKIKLNDTNDIELFDKQLFSSTVKILQLQQCSLNFDYIHTMKSFHNLTAIHLSNNRLIPKDVINLSYALRNHSALSSLNLSHNRIIGLYNERIYLCGKINFEGLSLLFDTLQHKPSLTHLDLSCNCLGGYDEFNNFPEVNQAMLEFSIKTIAEAVKVWEANENDREIQNEEMFPCHSLSTYQSSSTSVPINNPAESYPSNHDHKQSFQCAFESIQMISKFLSSSTTVIDLNINGNGFKRSIGWIENVLVPYQNDKLSLCGLGSCYHDFSRHILSSCKSMSDNDGMSSLLFMNSTELLSQLNPYLDIILKGRDFQSYSAIFLAYELLKYRNCIRTLDLSSNHEVSLLSNHTRSCPHMIFH
jgi:hypothetical protein